ncbi:diaminopimelate decarboxylase [Lachnospiraceae bacterium KH1T2]|nr:diaminopimelate decarboxylase [Lachnospiraceae bacterium KH1T2]
MQQKPETPYYVFNTEDFRKRVEYIKAALPEIPLVFSIKANPFLLTQRLPEAITKVEVCSPGELSICERLSVPSENIIYSGVMKEITDIREAIRYGAGILTAESIRHAELLEKGAECENISGKLKVILRLSAGSQFGMSEEDMLSLFERKADFKHLDFVGVHYYSGTGKSKVKKIEKDLKQIRGTLLKLKDQYDFEPEILEYGPGFAVEFFNPPMQEEDERVLREAAPLLNEFAKEVPLSFEMGRYMAATCGEYHTRVCDIKSTEGVTYVLLDGGMHQVNYFGQMMAMKMPPIRQAIVRSEARKAYTLCGSLCTTADVLARDAMLAPLEIGDELVFERVGAYSAMEAPALFLSRRLPEIWIEGDFGIKKIRGSEPTDLINVPDM